MNMDKKRKRQLAVITKKTREENSPNLSEANEKVKNITADDIAKESMKCIEAMIKTKSNDNDDDCYYVLVIDDPKGSDEEKEDVSTLIKKETQEIPIQQNISKQKETEIIEKNIHSHLIFETDENDQGNDDEIEMNSDDTFDETQDQFSEDSDVADLSDNELLRKLEEDINNKNISNPKNIITSLTKSGARHVKSDLVDNFTSQGESILYFADEASPLQLMNDSSKLADENDVKSQIKNTRVHRQQDGSYLCREKFDDSKFHKRYKSKHNCDNEQYGYNNTLRCNLCLKAFPNQNILKHHMMTHTGILEFKCDICSKRFNQKITMLKHRLTHVNTVSCNQCDKIFENKDDLVEHKQLGQCNKSIVTKVKEELIKTVKQDITTDTGKLLGYACSLCKRMFSVESALARHIERTHIVKTIDGQNTSKTMQRKYLKRFECGLCGKICTSKQLFAMHKKVHANQRPYSCEICESWFKTKSHLKTHQLIHTREKKFCCAVCKKSFAMKGNLVVHLRLHPDEWPFICSLCGDAFIDSKHLKKHRLKKHSMESSLEI